MPNASIKQIKKVNTNRLRNILDQATSDDWYNGLIWYEKARDICRGLSSEFSIPFDTVCKVMSILSPAVKWETNVLDCRKVLRAYTLDLDPDRVTVSTYGANKYKAFDVLNNVRDLLPSAKKTYAFYKNISCPVSDIVTVDRHAIKAVIPENRLPITESGAVSLTQRLYGLVEDAYRREAKRLGIKGFELQAVAWVTYKRIYGK